MKAMKSLFPFTALTALMAIAVFTACAAPRTLAQGYICADGGGIDAGSPWAREIFGWMVEKSRRGPAAIIGAVPTESDERISLLESLGSSKVFSLVITADNANDPAIIGTLDACSLIFIRGGDQSRYVNMWKATGTARAIIACFNRGGVVGGTSAGCAVLGEAVYDARIGSLSAYDALADSRHKDLTITEDFLSLVPGVLFDTHFTERGRIARLPVMLATLRVDRRRDYVGIGVDPNTAVCIEPLAPSPIMTRPGTNATPGGAEAAPMLGAAPGRRATIMGAGHAYIFTIAPASRITLAPGQPPHIESVRWARLAAGESFDAANPALACGDGLVSPVNAAHPPREVSIAWKGKQTQKTLSESFASLSGGAPILLVYAAQDAASSVTSVASLLLEASQTPPQAQRGWLRIGKHPFPSEPGAR